MRQPPDLAQDKRSIQKLRREVEKTKRALSSTHQARLEIEALCDGHLEEMGDGAEDDLMWDMGGNSSLVDGS